MSKKVEIKSKKKFKKGERVALNSDFMGDLPTGVITGVEEVTITSYRYDVKWDDRTHSVEQQSRLTRDRF